MSHCVPIRWTIPGLEFQEERDIFSMIGVPNASGHKHRCGACLEEQIDTSSTDGDQGSWSKMWKMQVPSKLKIFLWRLAQ